jgi:phosphatidylserine/phosphatidylglycerophosphate/cardiolipin synthase-like enzyme
MCNLFSHASATAKAPGVAAPGLIGARLFAKMDALTPTRALLPLLLLARVAAADALADDASWACSPQVGCSGVYPVRQSEGAILHNGDQSFAARIATLRRAKRSVRVQALIFHADEAGLFIADLLEQKKKEGLDVRVVVDATSNLDWQTQWMYFDLRQHGIEVDGYEPLYLEWTTADVKPDDPLRPNKRFHDKMWVIDGENPDGVAIVGGLNVANEYFRVDESNRWRDQDVMLRGPIVADVVQTFDRNVEYFAGLKKRLPAKAARDNAWRLSREVMTRVRGAKAPSWLRESLRKQVAAMAAAPFELSFHTIRARFLQSRPRFGETYIRQTYLDLIDRARTTIHIANAYFVPSRALVDALKRAARRGVKIVVITNSPESNDIRPVAVVSRYLYEEVLSVNAGLSGGGGIEVREWRGPAVGESTLHAKFAVFDGMEAIVGSFNLDPRSDMLNSETALVFRDADMARRLDQIFVSEDMPKATPVSASDAQSYRSGDVAKQFELLFSLPLRSWL